MKFTFCPTWSQRTAPTRASSAVISVQDLTYQSQPLFNIKDSNKVAHQKYLSYNACTWLLSLRGLVLNFFFCSQIQDERERYVARKFKYEDPRPEQIQDLEVCIIFIDVFIFLHII